MHFTSWKIFVHMERKAKEHIGSDPFRVFGISTKSCNFFVTPSSLLENSSNSLDSPVVLIIHLRIRIRFPDLFPWSFWMCACWVHWARWFSALLWQLLPKNRLPSYWHWSYHLHSQSSSMVWALFKNGTDYCVIATHCQRHSENSYYISGVFVCLFCRASF